MSPPCRSPWHNGMYVLDYGKRQDTSHAHCLTFWNKPGDAGSVFHQKKAAGDAIVSLVEHRIFHTGHVAHV